MADNLVVGIGTSPIWLFGLVRVGRFSLDREARVVRAYEQTGQLPAKWARRLRPKHFTATAN